MEQIKLEDLQLYMNDNDCIDGIAKDGKVYGLSFETGELEYMGDNYHVDVMWGGCPLEYAEEIQAKIKAGLKK